MAIDSTSAIHACRQITRSAYHEETFGEKFPGEWKKLARLSPLNLYAVFGKKNLKKILLKSVFRISLTETSPRSAWAPSRRKIPRRNETLETYRKRTHFLIDSAAGDSRQRFASSPPENDQLNLFATENRTTPHPREMRSVHRFAAYSASQADHIPAANMRKSNITTPTRRIVLRGVRSPVGGGSDHTPA